MSSLSTVEVVVIGAGYARAVATNRFLPSMDDSERARIRVTVVNPRAEFVERIRLHELAAGSRDSVTMPFTDVLYAAVVKERVCSMALAPRRERTKPGFSVAPKGPEAA